MNTPVAYEEQIISTVRRLPSRKKLEVLKFVQQMEKEAVEEETKPKLPQFMQNMIAAGTLELSDFARYMKTDPVKPQVSLEEFRRRLREKGVSVPIEKYIREERDKR